MKPENRDYSTEVLDVLQARRETGFLIAYAQTDIDKFTKQIKQCKFYPDRENRT